MKSPAVYCISATDGKRTEIVGEPVSGLEFGPDGLLYACQGTKSRVISIDVNSGEVKTIATGVTPNDLAVTDDGFILITETRSGQIIRINSNSGETVVVATGVTRPNGIALSNDGGTLAVSEYCGEHAWMFRVNPDGALDAQMPSMTLRFPIDNKGEFKFNEPPPYQTASRGDGMAVDKKGC